MFLKSKLISLQDFFSTPHGPRAPTTPLSRRQKNSPFGNSSTVEPCRLWLLCHVGVSAFGSGNEQLNDLSQDGNTISI